MSAGRVNTYSPSTGVLDNVIGVIDEEVIGALSISITNYNSTTRPALCADSIVEVAGNVFQFSTENTISTAGVTSTAACDYYINLVPSSSECSAQFSTVVPTWRTDYQGYYENSTSVNRVIGVVSFTGVDYVNKKIFFGRDIMKSNYCYGILSTTATSPSTLYIPMNDYIKNIVSIDVQVQSGPPYRYISSYTIGSTYVRIVWDDTTASTVAVAVTVIATGVNY